MKNRKLKIGIDILLTIFFILSFGISVGMETSHHIAIGIIVTILSALHIVINRKQILSVFKTTQKKRNTKTKLQYGVSLVLTITWSICVITGILTGFPGILYNLVGASDLFIFTAIHILTAFLSLILVIVHVAQHLRHIKSYIKYFDTKQRKSI